MLPLNKKHLFFVDVDRAILRRMPATFHIGLPDERQRNSIFRRILGMERIQEDLDFSRLAKLTEGFSGSDIREACRTASVYRMREFASTLKADNAEINSALEDSCNQENYDSKSSGDGKTNELKDLRSINNEDLLKAIGKLRESKLHCGFNAPKFSSVGGLD